VQYRDTAGNESISFSDTVILDTTAPTGNILIEGGDVVVDRQVVLTLNAYDANGVMHMRLRNDSEAWGTWEPFATSRTWTLPAQEGEHTVEVQFRDAAGNTSIAYSDSVIYQPSEHYVYLPLVVRGDE